MKFDDAKPKVGRQDVKLEDLVDMLKLPDGKWVEVRILPSDMLPVRRHWINIIGGKSRKEVKIPKFCVAHDTATDEDKPGVTCPYCAIAGNESFYLQNVISREIQENAPRKPKGPSKSEAKSGFKAPGSEAFTPVRVLRIPSSLAQKIQGLKELNKVKKDGKATKYSVAHPKFGCDISIKYDSKQKGVDKYQVQLRERTKLTEEELELLQFELKDELLTKAGREDEKTAKKEISRMELAGGEDEADSDDDDDDDVNVGKKKKSKKGKPDKKAGKKSKKSDDDDDDDDDEDDDEEEKSSKSKKSKGGKKKPADDDDDDEDDDDSDDDDDDDSDDDEDEDEDDEPKGKKSKGKPAKKSKKSRDEDDDDEDDDDAEDDDDDDSDEDDEDEDDDEDDEPKGKKGKASKKPVKSSKGKKSKKSDDDDEDDDDAEDDDDDEDDDEDDEPKGKKSKSSKKSSKSGKSDKKAKGKKSKKSDDDDDDSDDDDDDDIPF